MDVIIARSRRYRWTAFRTVAGMPVVNAEDEDGPVTIALSEEDAARLAAQGGGQIVDDLLRDGVRLVPPLATPLLSPHERLAA